MTHLFVNAGNVTASGPRALVFSLIPELIRARPDARFTFFVPDDADYRKLVGSHEAHFVEIRRGISNEYRRMKQLFRDVPRLVRESGADVCLSLGDLGPVSLPVPHVVLLHNARFVYSEKEMLGASEWSAVKRFYLTTHFSQSAKRAAAVVVQTPVMAERLLRAYRLRREQVEVVGQPMPETLAALSSSHGEVPPQMAASEARHKLFFLASMYALKNHAILPAVGEELERRGLARDFHLFLTLNERDERAAAILARCDPAVVTNLGHLSAGRVAGALQEATALFLPTIVESYGFIYLEAMAFGKPILTSDRDFARWMCGDLADYFEPFDPRSIVDAFERLAQFRSSRDFKREGEARLAGFPSDWCQVAQAFWNVLERAAQTRS